PDGYAHCHFVKAQATCTDSAGRKLVPVIAVEGVMPDSTAERAKLQVGDLLVSYDGNPVGEMSEFIDRVAQPGQSARLLVILRGARRLAISVPPGRLGIQIRAHYVLPAKLLAP
ncbi:MAG: PDZ domain-containing protein, partial [Stellaceae bacterium]